MKRSEINDNIRLAIDVFEAFRFQLPKWAFWKSVNWEHSGPEVLDIKRCGLGWDVTDFGLGNFREQGLVQFMPRNGAPPPDARKAEKNTPPPAPHYSEKIILLQLRQVCPLLYFKKRPRDLVNRNGGDLVVQIYASTTKGEIDEENRVAVWINGIAYNIRPGALVRLVPGDSLTVSPGLYHKFWAEKSSCLLGEVSLTCDEARDYCFHDSQARRYPSIEEDEPPLHLLHYEYPDFE